jgi:hypothetical protein
LARSATRHRRAIRDTRAAQQELGDVVLLSRFMSFARPERRERNIATRRADRRLTEAKCPVDLDPLALERLAEGAGREDRRVIDDDLVDLGFGARPDGPARDDRPVRGAGNDSTGPVRRQTSACC